MTRVMPFQEATVEAALRALRARRRLRRFLVADEVGLGKTVVAQQVIRRMIRYRSEPLVVFYVCSNLSIAAQNRRKLLEFLPPAERPLAYCNIDRLTLMPGSTSVPFHPRLHLYTITPDTSVPLRKNRRRDGRQEERALIHALVEKTIPGLLTKSRRHVFRRNARVYWDYFLQRAREKAESRSLQAAFRRSVRQEFRLKKGAHLLPVLRDLEDLDLIARLRNALAASALEELQPDLVIFDEFQRFRDLIEPQVDEAAERVIRKLRGDEGEAPPALLLLSATPYRLYARRAEESAAGEHHREFFELIEFLFGRGGKAKRIREECEADFSVLQRALLQGEEDSGVALEARRRVEGTLSRVMARTERSARVTLDQIDSSSTEGLPAPLLAEDLAVFRHLTESVREEHRGSTVPYWTSIPLPMQTMGSRYVIWDKAKDVPAGQVPKLDLEMRDRFKAPDPWPHPRLRALREIFPPEQTVAPWVAPSVPWWPLAGRWKDPSMTPRKILLFSRFQAVPTAVSAALSFDMEARYLSGDGLAYADATKRRALTATQGRHNILALFHPSPFLVERTDPLVASGQPLEDVQRAVKQQVGEALRRLGVRIEPSARRSPLWQLLARIEVKAGFGEVVEAGWREVSERGQRSDDGEGGLAQLVEDWVREASRPLVDVHPEQLAALAQHALGAPGVVMGRALHRHWSGAVREAGFRSSLDASWNGLRNYLDQRWFFEGLKHGSENFPDTIQRLAIEGNLEAVLDEHLWITGRLASLEGPELAQELARGWSVRSGLARLHNLGDRRGDSFSLRCHVAMPFARLQVDTRREVAAGDGPSLRTDDLRRAFNTPFWPFLLATTSVGQEGLDFHAWCDTVVHWDLCRNPVDLEQREGRIQRFGGLSIRRAVVQGVAGEGWPACQVGESPWKAVARLAETKLADASGLSPWWVCEGGSVNRYVFDVPTSEQRHWLAWVHQQRLWYRLALGQPNQEDLVEILARKGNLTPEEAKRASINLSPWFQKKSNEESGP